VRSMGDDPVAPRWLLGRQGHCGHWLQIEEPAAIARLADIMVLGGGVAKRASFLEPIWVERFALSRRIGGVAIWGFGWKSW